MGVNARASLFYGIVINEDAARKLLKRFEAEMTENFGEEYDFDEDSLEYVLEALANLKNFKIVFREFSDADDEYGIAVYKKDAYDFEETKKFKMPDEENLNEKWAKLAERLKLGKRKPGWYLFTEDS